MKRILLAAAAAAALTACEPEYDESAGAAPEQHLEVTGGADTGAVSGRVPGDTGGTIHHPAADGNSGRPADATSLRDTSAGIGTSGIGTTGAAAGGSGDTRGAAGSEDGGRPARDQADTVR